MSAALPAIRGGRPVRSRPLPVTRLETAEGESAALNRVVERGAFCSLDAAAEEVPALEQEFATAAGVAEAVACNSGTTAELAVLMALGIGRGDEIIAPPLTFASAAYTALWLDAKPVFADVDPSTWVLDPAAVEQAMSSRTRAIVAVHWFGRPVDIEALRQVVGTAEVAIIEDCAHALGTRRGESSAGSWGDSAYWSLQESKPISAGGEGGMVACRDAAVSARVRQIVDHGKNYSRGDGLYWIDRLGMNFRMTELQGAFARAQLEAWPARWQRRATAAELMMRRLGTIAGIRLPSIPAGATISHVGFPVWFDPERIGATSQGVARALHAEGIMAHPFGADEFLPPHPIFREAGGLQQLPVATRIAAGLIGLPLFPAMTAADVDDIGCAVEKISEAGLHGLDLP